MPVSLLREKPWSGTWPWRRLDATRIGVCRFLLLVNDLYEWYGSVINDRTCFLLCEILSGKSMYVNPSSSPFCLVNNDKGFYLFSSSPDTSRPRSQAVHEHCPFVGPENCRRSECLTTDRGDVQQQHQRVWEGEEMVRSTSFAGLAGLSWWGRGSKTTMLLHSPFGRIQMETWRYV